MLGAWGSVSAAVMPKLVEYETAMVIETSSASKITTSGDHPCSYLATVLCRGGCVQEHRRQAGAEESRHLVTNNLGAAAPPRTSSKMKEKASSVSSRPWTSRRRT